MDLNEDYMLQSSYEKENYLKISTQEFGQEIEIILAKTLYPIKNVFFVIFNDNNIFLFNLQ